MAAVRDRLTVSAIISNYNYGRFLRAAVDSVLNQTRSVDEIVIVDDGSTDDSCQVLETLANDRPGVKAVFQTNAGQAAAINSGFKQCSGEIVCMLDADDVWHAQKVERVLQGFVQEPAAVMVMHEYDLIDSSGAVVQPAGSGAFASGNLARTVAATGGAWIFGATSSLSLRRSALETILPIPAERWRLCADGAIAYPAAFLGTVVSLNQVLGGYRIHGSNNHYAAAIAGDKVQADVEMTNKYLNDFLMRIGRPERVDLSKNLGYRRDRFYRHGGDAKEVLAIMKLIVTWPLYDGPSERAKFLARFVGRTLTSAGNQR